MWLLRTKAERNPKINRNIYPFESYGSFELIEIFLARRWALIGIRLLATIKLMVNAKQSSNFSILIIKVKYGSNKNLVMLWFSQTKRQAWLRRSIKVTAIASFFELQTSGLCIWVTGQWEAIALPTARFVPFMTTAKISMLSAMGLMRLAMLWVPGDGMVVR